MKSSIKLDITNTIKKSLQIATPSWPLQNTVAVNPFWFLRQESFNSALENLAPVIHSSLFMPLNYYLERFKSGEITESSLNESLQINGRTDPELPHHIPEFIRTCQEEEPFIETWKAWSEQYEIKKNWHAKVIADIGKYSASYLDEQQAIARFPWRNLPFWEGWLQAQNLDVSMETQGARGFHTFILELRELDSEFAIIFMLQRMGFSSEQGQIHYMQRLIASVLGWASQFKYSEWQRQLGYSVENKAQTRDLLAVRMAYDFALFCISQRENPSHTQAWQASFACNSKENSSGSEQKSAGHFRRHYVFQLAFELSYQKKIASQMILPVLSSEELPDAQLVFCIDVRSEMLRRHIESIDKKLQTIGFAGFFGVPFDYKPIGESKVGHRLPVLLTPAFEVNEKSLPNQQKNVDNRIILGQVASFFRSLRKNPVSSFLYVELFGALYIEKMIRRTLLFIIKRLKRRRLPHRFDPRGVGPSQSEVVDSQGLILDYTQKIDRAETVLRHMGLTESFSPLVFLFGHGSVTTNNAFGSSLDCGACGGHAGDINARFLADLLNDTHVRKGIALKGIHIPERTWFIAGVHETVTDEVHILETEKIPNKLHILLAGVTHTLARASENTRQERLSTRSIVLDDRAHQRSQNWSEVRPEWGLAGNACFIIAPRNRTRSVNLGSRSFLHDYDWKKDSPQNYKTLELIMTAPMIVTNWINLQYYASTVAPSVFGSGNKILHNLTNEIGVVEGNGGDLRVGLPIQSVHDGNQFVHDPLRLSVFIEAPLEEIERIIQKHEVVRELFDQEWLHLLQIDPMDLRVKRRYQGGQWKVGAI